MDSPSKALARMLLSIMCVSLCAGEPPDRSVLAADAKRLDALEDVFVVTQAGGDQFGETFWRASQRLAEERGVPIIHAIMERSREWQGEEGMIFVPLIALLPREAARKQLEEYQAGPDERLKLWAEECLIEFEASDVEEAVEKYRAEQTSPAGVPPGD